MTMYIPKPKNNQVFCDFKQVTDTVWECAVCGQKVEFQSSQVDMPILPCRGGTKKTNSENNQVSKMIAYRYSICRTCEFFKNNTCSKCGCIISPNNIDTNKLSDQNDKCPIDKW
jgi:hypothetical protein